MARKSNKRGPGKRYTPAEKAKILAVAAKEGLTGEQVAKKFGIAQLTFYRWRGPVRGKKARAAAGAVKIDQGAVRKAARAQIEKMLPQIIREEIEAALR